MIEIKLDEQDLEKAAITEFLAASFVAGVISASTLKKLLIVVDQFVYEGSVS